MHHVLIADDHALIRQGLRKLLDAQHDLRIAAEASNAAEVVQLLSRLTIDLVIMDVNMPGQSGIDILRELQAHAPKTRVLMLSMHPEETIAVRALKAGAAGYVTKDSPPEELLKAIRKVLGGGKYVSEAVADRLAEDLAKPSNDRPHEHLSQREFDVLCLIGQGKAVSEIAQTLSLSVPTITTYRSRILQKMNMKTTAELIHYAIKHQLVESLQ